MVERWIGPLQLLVLRYLRQILHVRVELQRDVLLVAQMLLEGKVQRYLKTNRILSGVRNREGRKVWSRVQVPLVCVVTVTCEFVTVSVPPFWKCCCWNETAGFTPPPPALSSSSDGGLPEVLENACVGVAMVEEEIG
uniref:Uncharacterized protein n=1 Tax=Anopheles farauti TaxID=69004 RepID=A0A182QUC0_9DIPT